MKKGISIRLSKGDPSTVPRSPVASPSALLHEPLKSRPDQGYARAERPAGIPQMSPQPSMAPPMSPGVGMHINQSPQQAALNRHHSALPKEVRA
jgi:hypothetical protein